MPTEATCTPSPLDAFSHVLKAGLSAIGLLYALGLVTVALYASQFGVMALDLVKAQYVLAGFWVILPLLLVLLSISLSATIMRYKLKDEGPLPVTRRRQVLYWCFVVCGAVLLLSMCIGIGLWMLSPLPFSSRLVWEHCGGALGLGMLGYLTLGAIKESAQALRQHWSDGPVWDLGKPRFQGVFVWGSLAIVGVAAYLGRFALTLYALIPPAIGGGQPLIVQLIRSGSSAAVPDTDFQAVLGRGRLDKFELLLETSRGYVLRRVRDPLDQGRPEVFELARDGVAGLVLFGASNN
jgi:hypothetical protein